MKRSSYVIAIALLVLAPVSTSAASSFKVIVNNAVHVDALSKKEVADLFMKRTPKWSNGTPVVPATWATRAAVPVRARAATSSCGARRVPVMAPSLS